MSPERWQIVKEIFETALDAPAARRASYLDSACGADRQLRGEVERLLEQDEAAGDFLLTSLVHPERLLDSDPERPLLENGNLILDRFQIVRFLGAGGMGEVYEALDRVLGARVALKTIRAELAGDERVLDQFRSEVQLAREVTHPNVCRIHDLFAVAASSSDPGPRLAFLTMEYISGETLAERLRKQGALPQDIALPLIRQVAEGLAAAHAAGIVHRDLKTANIMLTRDRRDALRAVVMDFGVALAAGKSGTAIFQAGTPRYMAPEQRQGRPATARSDVFALGVISHEVLAGAPPRAHQRGDELERAVSRELRPRWRRAIARCLDAEPARRFAGALEFASALDAPRGTRRSVVLGLAAAAGFGGAIVWRERATRYRAGPSVPRLVVIPFTPAAPDRDLAALGAALANEVIRALSISPELFVIGEESTRIAAAAAVPSLYAAQPPDPAVTASTEGAAKRFAMGVGNRLGVPYVLTGSVSRPGDNIGVSVTLRSARDGAVIWAQAFADEAANLPRFQGKIAQGVATAVNSTFASWAKTAFARPLTANADAYLSYLLGRSSGARRSVKDLEESVSYLNEALRLDSNFAEAYAALGACYNILAGRPNHPLDVSFAAARQACQKALALSPGLGDAHVVLGSVYQRFDWSWPASDAEYRAALSANPGLAVAHQWYSGLLSIRRLPDEAVFESARARDLEPLSLAANTAYGAMLYRARRYGEATAQLEFTLKLAPEYQPALTVLGIVYGRQGKWDLAIRQHERCAALSNQEPGALSWLGYSLASAGFRERAVTIQGELERRWPTERFSPSALAQISQGLGDLDGTFRWLEIALQVRDPSLTTLRADPSNDLLRNDPRYERIVRQLNL
jgi:serine/threonine-protein kinase